MAMKTPGQASRRTLLGLSLLSLLFPALPLKAAMPGTSRGAVARLLRAALPAHHRLGHPLPDLPMSRLKDALVATSEQSSFDDQLLSRLGLTPALCRRLPVTDLRERLQQAIRDDFRQGSMVEVDGWCLSRVEGIVYALSYERQVSGHRPGGAPQDQTV